jgi:GntR family transcriptional regulator / MocR family aminotransferase
MKRVPSGIVPILAVDRRLPKPLQNQIYDGYRAAIVERRLRSGQRVPSTRVLATELGVSRIPVLNAYAQLLAEGYLESRIGSGTVVSRSLPEQLGVSKPSRAHVTATRSRPRPISKSAANLHAIGNIPWALHQGAFGVGQIAFDAFPSRLWSRLVVRHSRNSPTSDLHYGQAMGLRDLREAIANYLGTARGVRCDAQQIMIVSGSQQALEISARVLLDPGSRVWIEEPGYQLARHVLAMNGAQMIPVPVDEEGLDVAAGIERYRYARAASVTPSHQYPLGVTMSAARRFQLLEWAETSGSWIFEDDYDSEYRYESRPIASLQGLDSNSRVIYIGTFSKVLFPSLRLGYVVIPTDLVDHFVAVRRAMDLGPATFLQSVLADFIREGHFSRHIRRMRILYAERRNVLVKCLKQEFGSSVQVRGGEAGMHLVITFSKRIPDRELTRIAAHQNLWLLPLSTCYFGKPVSDGLIIGFGSTPVEEIPKGVRKLRNLIRANGQEFGPLRAE